MFKAIVDWIGRTNPDHSKTVILGQKVRNWGIPTSLLALGTQLGPVVGLDMDFAAIGVNVKAAADAIGTLIQVIPELLVLILGPLIVRARLTNSKPVDDEGKRLESGK